MYFGEPRDELDGKMTVVPYVALVGCAAIIGLAWLPGVNLFGLEASASQAAAMLLR
ncbi:Proton-translocating NADH-quinone oxidoreductase, chain N [Roseibacterium elongatum DSM 19469]|uniref:Proton-translocating NADH-quinone oxidoreductase, chain N n=1 Tax=Roseicyclus elongatus DSM 19469 TaxID=1294273 RepID=W8S1L7_9RHOB|nr:Proton-translocating NADH-quinone oxidoreductase, chain N [Roseibacterium elongatum DSM 19469]